MNNFTYLIIFINVIILNCIMAQQNQSEIDNLLRTDSLFSETSVKLGSKEAFGQFLLPNSIALSDNQDAKFGLEKILSGFPDKSENILIWEPQDGEVSECKTMGWTWGIYYVKSKADNSVIQKGKYLNIWKKDSEGNWKVKVDMGNSSPKK